MFFINNDLKVEITHKSNFSLSNYSLSNFMDRRMDAVLAGMKTTLISLSPSEILLGHCQ